MISLREMELSVGQCVVEELDGATLTFDTLPNPIVVPCTITPIIKDFQMIGGQSATTYVEVCIFRASYIEGITEDNVIKKGLHCILTPIPGADTIGLQLWHGGLMPGARLYNFMLADENYKA